MSIASPNLIQAERPPEESIKGLYAPGRLGIAAALSTAAIASFAPTAAYGDEITPQHVDNHHLVATGPPVRSFKQFLNANTPNPANHGTAVEQLSVSAETASSIEATGIATEFSSWFDHLDSKEEVELSLDIFGGLLALGGLGVVGIGFLKAEGDWKDRKEEIKERFKEGAIQALNAKYSDLVVAASLASAIDGAAWASNTRGIGESLVVTGGLVFIGAAESYFDLDRDEELEGAILQKIPAVLAAFFAGATEAGLHPSAEFGFAPVLAGAAGYAMLKAFNRHRIGSRRAVHEKFESTFGFKIPALNEVQGMLHGRKLHNAADALRIPLMKGDEVELLLRKGEDPDDPQAQGALDAAYDQIIVSEKHDHRLREQKRQRAAKQEGTHYKPREFERAVVEAKYQRPFADLRVAIEKLIKIRIGDTLPDHEWSRTAVMVADGDKSKQHDTSVLGSHIVGGDH